MVLPPQNRLCNEVCLEASQYPNSNELYLNSSELLKTELNNDINLCLVDFCERHNIGYRGKMMVSVSAIAYSASQKRLLHRSVKNEL